MKRHRVLSSKSLLCGFVSVVIGVALACGPEAWAAVKIEYVPVGDAGNVDDTHGDGYGGVAYNYWIGKYEVTNAQYREFLNAKAGVGDPYSLYSVNMAGMYGGIDRSGSGTGADPWVYTAKGGDANWDAKPVSFVSWYDAIRFVNWLQNGQGGGDTETGTYTITGGGADSGTVTVPTEAQRATWAAANERYVLLPSDDEWYKAAYYKGGGTNAGYWDYATQKDAPPTSEAPPGTDLVNGSANYDDSGHAVGAPYYSTSVGAYTAKPSDSAYGTFDQSGNLWEWNEGLHPLGVDRVFRGGSWYDDAAHMLASLRNEGDPGIGWSNVGFRVALIPEPATMGLLCLGSVSLIALRSKRRKR